MYGMLVGISVLPFYLLLCLGGEEKTRRAIKQTRLVKRERGGERVCVCVCEREREREREDAYRLW